MEDILLLGGVKPTQTARRLCEKAVTLAGNSKYTPLLVTRLGKQDQIYKIKELNEDMMLQHTE